MAEIDKIATEKYVGDRVSEYKTGNPSRIPDFLDSLEKMRTIHIKKNSDYASDTNPFFNFDVQEYFIALVTSDRDKVYAGIVGLKFARIANLLNNRNKVSPKNESIEDSFIDLANYVLLWKADLQRRK